MFKSLKKGLDDLGKDISKGLDSASKQINTAFDEHRTSPILDMFKSGNVVQLISRSSGRTLQIVQNAAGLLVVDGAGLEGPEHYHAHWTVLNEGKNTVKLYNRNNYLAIVNGATQLLTVNDPAMVGVETRIRLSQTGNFIMLESAKEYGHHVGILANGQLKSALATGTEIDAQFGVRLIYTPYTAAAAMPPPGQHYTTTTTTTTYEVKKK